MLRSSLIIILCGTLAACSAEREYYSFDAKTNTGDDVLLVCVKDPAQELIESKIVDDYRLLADGRSYLATIKVPGKVKQLISSPIDTEPCKSLIERDTENSAGEAAAELAAGILLGIPICIATFGVVCTP